MGRIFTSSRVLLIVIYLLLGAALSVATAWGFAARRAFITIERNVQGYALIWNRPMQVVLENRFGMTDVWWYDLYDENSTTIPAQELVAINVEKHHARIAAGQRLPSGRTRMILDDVPRWGTLHEENVPPDLAMGGDIAFGFPLKCLWMQTKGDVILNKTANEEIHGAWLVHGTLETRGNEFIALPYWITWPGFVINTLFYALIAWLMFVFPGKARRSSRERRRLCPACAYPIGISPVCTECGQSIQNSPPQSSS